MLSVGNVVYFEVDEAALSEIKNRLGLYDKKAPQVLKNAVNATAREIQGKLAKKAQQTYAVKTARFKKNAKLTKATTGNPVAYITATGAREPLSDFQTRKHAGGASAKAKVLKAGGLKNMTAPKSGLKAFMVAFDSGHIAVVRRYPGEKYSNAGKVADRQAKGWDMTAIREFTAASVPYMLGNEYRVYGVLEPEFEQMLKANVDKEIEKVLFGGKA